MLLPTHLARRFLIFWFCRLIFFLPTTEPKMLLPTHLARRSLIFCRLIFFLPPMTVPKMLLPTHLALRLLDFTCCRCCLSFRHRLVRVRNLSLNVLALGTTRVARNRTVNIGFSSSPADTVDIAALHRIPDHTCYPRTHFGRVRCHVRRVWYCINICLW